MHSYQSREGNLEPDNWSLHSFMAGGGSTFALAGVHVWWDPVLQPCLTETEVTHISAADIPHSTCYDTNNQYEKTFGL